MCRTVGNESQLRWIFVGTGVAGGKGLVKPKLRRQTTILVVPATP
jgi:hypothetical protein